MTVVDWVRSRLGGIQSDSNSDQYYVNCPWTDRHLGKPDTKRRMGILLEGRGGGVCHCFRCDYQSSVYKLIMTLDGIPYDQLKDWIRFSREAPSFDSFDSYTPKSNTLEKVELPEDYAPLDRQTIIHRMVGDYLTDRGVLWETIEEYKIGWCSIGNFAQRVIFPIYFKGVCVGYQGRFIDDGIPKYRFPSGSMINHTLYNYDRVQSREDVILVEGILDALVLPERCVAIFGKQLSSAQRKLIVQTWQQVYVLLDEEEYHVGANDVCASLDPFVNVQKLHVSGDPNEAGREVILNALDSPAFKDVFNLDKIK